MNLLDHLEAWCLRTFIYPPVREVQGRLVHGYGPWKFEWYSICSTHYTYEQDCLRCRNGQWVHVWTQFWSELFYKLFPSLWQRLRTT